MGSGSSKSRRRTIKVCTQPPLDPTESSRGDCAVEGRVAFEQAEKGNDRGTTAKGSMPAMEVEGGRLTPLDTELQLLVDILAESEGCLSWQVSTCEGQMMTNSPYSNANPGSLSQVQQNQRQDTRARGMSQNTPELEPASTECEKTQYRRQVVRDSGKKTAPVTKGVLDIENNNLPQFSHTCPTLVEAPAPITYDVTEEAMMDSIEQEYSQPHPTSPVCCMKI